MMVPRGAIHSKNAYALGKMLDHSSWRLPRGITPSDNDLYFDDRGKIIYVELSREHDKWSEISQGQREGYQGMITNDGIYCAVLAKHDVDPSLCREINTCTDVERFQVMVWDRTRWGSGYRYSKVFVSNEKWQEFVYRWYDGPQALLCRIFGRVA
jgi:hypothetical protein